MPPHLSLLGSRYCKFSVSDKKDTKYFLKAPFDENVAKKLGVVIKAAHTQTLLIGRNL